MHVFDWIRTGDRRPSVSVIALLVDMETLGDVVRERELC